VNVNDLKLNFIPGIGWFANVSSTGVSIGSDISVSSFCATSFKDSAAAVLP